MASALVNLWVPFTKHNHCFEGKRPYVVVPLVAEPLSLAQEMQKATKPSEYLHGVTIVLTLNIAGVHSDEVPPIITLHVDG